MKTPNTSTLNIIKTYIRKADSIRAYVVVSKHIGQYVSISKKEAMRLFALSVESDDVITSIKVSFDEERKILRIG